MGGGGGGGGVQTSEQNKKTGSKWWVFGLNPYAPTPYTANPLCKVVYYMNHTTGLCGSYYIVHNFTQLYTTNFACKYAPDIMNRGLLAPHMIVLWYQPTCPGSAKDFVIEQ